MKQVNENKEIHGMIVQLPLPSHIEEHVVLDSINPEKDVDGLHPLHLGDLFLFVFRIYLSRNFMYEE